MYLNIEDTEFIFEIRNYNPNCNKDNWDELWCKVTVVVKNKYFKYRKIREELLLSSEIDDLKEKLQKLLNNKLTEKEEISFIEPDLSVVLYPQHDVRTSPNVVYVKEGCEIQDVLMDFELNVTDNIGAYTNQKYSFTLDREEIQKIYNYLNSPEIEKDTNEVEDDYIDIWDEDDDIADLLDISIKDIEEVFDDEIIKRGEDYFYSDRITSLNKEEDTYIAEVSGSCFDHYTVIVKMDDENNITYMDCTCPCEFFCKHEYATILQIREEKENMRNL